MTARETDWWSLLRELDDPEHVQFPKGYRHAEARARFERLVTRLETDFACRSTVDRSVQDASHHGDVVIPGDRTVSGERIYIRISNFGDLAVYSPENLGCYTDAEKSDVLHDEDRRRVESALTDLGYLNVPEDLLSEPYDGRSALASYLLPRYPPSWFIRFFDYL
ncbi:hypothetical protein [Planomonospora venezuelensis]|uniref:Uncharacterized protein n=1 Tax=Planomonospora venezuelensis TaxID=1999 RepID=A0A841D2Q7_PLAVE|nr:hypothetical protein [Planomonospora venezuelensis]MBB5963769.1 hypothetical protein [Planomonospora venezuelensis]GIM99555.1 hypothetical protein Pve01_12140 [Planomonospora venezuelensis]